MIQGADVVLDRFVKTCDFPYRFVVAYQVKRNDVDAGVAKASGKTFGNKPQWTFIASFVSPLMRANASTKPSAHFF